MNKLNTLKNCLLIAMPCIKNPEFKQSVIYVYEHTEQGAIGIIINKPAEMTLEGLLGQLDLPILSQEGAIETRLILLGGSVAQKHGFIFYLDKRNEIQLTSSKMVLKAIGEGKGPADFFVTLGYSGWEAGVLEQEILDNKWLLLPVEPRLLFHTPLKDRWRVAASLIGVDFTFLSQELGHS